MSKRLAAIGMAALVAGAGAASAAGSSYGSAASARLQVRTGKLGRYVADAHGLTLYLFEKDSKNKSRCYGTCAKVWAPYLTSGRPAAAKGVTASKLSVTRRSDGTRQVTYAGHPLYHYADDHKAGQTKGEGLKQFGAEWYVVAPSGKKIDKS